MVIIVAIGPLFTCFNVIIVFDCLIFELVVAYCIVDIVVFKAIVFVEDVVLIFFLSCCIKSLMSEFC